MPRAPVTRIGDQRIQERALPVVPAATQAPIEAFGGGGEALTAQVRAVARQTISAGDQELDRVNKLWFMQAENQMAAKQLEIESRAKETKGQDSFGLVNDTGKEFDTFAEQIMKTANNQSQRDGFSQISSSRKQSMNRVVTGHVDNEFEAVQDQEFIAAKFNLSNSAAANSEDPLRIAEDKLKYDSIIEDEAERQGLGGEARKAFRLQSNTRFHVKVIEQMLADGDNAHAKQYFKDNGDEITEDAKTALLPAIEEAGFRAEAQALTDGLMVDHFGLSLAAPPLSWEKRFEEAKKIKDPKLRDEVVRRLDIEFSREKRLERERDNDNYMDSLNLVEANQGVNPKDIVTVDKWSRMTEAQRNSLKRMSNFAEETMDYNLYREYYSLPPEKKAAMDQSELSVKYLSHFDPTYRKAAIDLWIRDSDAVATGSHIKTKSTPQEIADRFLKDEDFLDELGARELSGSDLKKYRLFNEIFERKVQDWEKENGKLPPEEESKKLASETWLESIRISDDDTSAFSGAKRTTFEEATVGELEKAGRPFEDIGTKKVLEIQNLLRSLGVSKPTGLDERATTEEKTSNDQLYSRLIKRYARAISNKDFFEAKQLVIQYKKDIKD